MHDPGPRRDCAREGGRARHDDHLVGLVLGHVLGGPDPNDCTVLALSTSTRHPAMALAIAHDMPDKQGLVAAVLLVTLVGAIVSAIYLRLRPRRRTEALQRSGHHDAG